MLLLALIVMMCATLAQHLGLTEAIAGVVSRMASCPKCCSFWGTLAVLYMAGCPVVFAAGLALLAAYLSHWFGILLIIFQNIHTWLWQRVTRNKQSNP